MAKRNAIDLSATVNADGFDISGGTTSRTLTVTGGNATITGGGSAVVTFPSATGTLATLTLEENIPLVLDSAMSADGKYVGIVEAGTAGETLVFGNTVYFKAADSRWWLTDADADATAGAVKIGICVLAAASGGSATTVLMFGKIRADSLFPTFTIGDPVYLSTTAGAVQVAQPSGTDDIIRIVGHGKTANELYWNPSNDWISHT